jgi:hypothetical protein
MKHLSRFDPQRLYESAGLWRVIDEADMMSRDFDHRIGRIDTLSDGDISAITDLFAPRVGSCDRVTVGCHNYKRNISESDNPRLVYTHDLTSGKKEVLMPRTPVHKLTISVDWHRHRVSVTKTDDDYYVVAATHPSGPIGNEGDKYYLCDGLAGVRSLLSGRMAGLFARKGPLDPRRGDILFRDKSARSWGYYLVASSTNASVTWVPAMYIGCTVNHAPIFNTERPGVVALRRGSFRPADAKSLEAIGRAAHSGRYDRYLQVIEEVTGIDLRQVLPGGRRR